MTRLENQFEFLKDVAKLIQKAEELGFVITAGEMFRTPEQQAIYVKAGRSKTMNSKHLDRLAVDFNVFKDGKMCDENGIRPLGEFWESLNPINRWGGNFPPNKNGGRFIDAPHFQRTL